MIFICERDPFGHGLPVYTIERTCLEDTGCEVACGSHWLVLNASAWRQESDEGLRNLLSYVRNGTIANDDALIGDIAGAVHEANHDERWVSEMFSVSTVEEDIARNARIRIRQAKAEGIAEGEARYNRLVAKLASEGRLDELAQATEDPALLESLFAELQ